MDAKKVFLLGLLSLSLFAFRDADPRRVSHKNIFRHKLESDVYIVVIKSSYELQVYDKEGWYATYPVVFGSKSLEDKMMEGDRKTPEGTYHIISKRRHEKWDKMMDIDYPTKADYEKFNDRKAKGLIPKNAKIGNGIAIHGTWQHDEHVVDMYQNWTNGCISLKNEDVDELYDLVPVGTKVIIKK
ncbi:MAG: L,D-transpeptidase [Bacteroidetes bacterium]|nr:L,D-transpeptidase [Bacteroidota bacterium]MBS1933068.1 L,D-transpeptidase [Bacteroidota bacterium]